MDRKSKQAVIGTSIVLVIILVVALFSLIKALTPSKEIMPLNEYYSVNDEEVVLILQDHVYEKTGKLFENTIYVDYETIKNEFNHRFYWDNNENILTYTKPNEVIRTEVGSKEYYINKSKNEVSYTIVKTNGEEVYVALEYVAMFSDMKYEAFEQPNRVVVNYKWDEYLFASVKKDTKVRVEKSIKSPILASVKKNDTLMFVDAKEDAGGKFTKVITKDGVIGYVKNKHLNSSNYEQLKSDYKAPVYTHISKDYNINMAWHQVTNMDANRNLLAIIDQTKGLTTISPTWFSVNSNKGTISSLASAEYVEKAHNLGIEVWALVDDFDPQVSLLKVLSSTSTREKLVNQLIAEAIKFNLDGINIDFEHITKESAAHYVQFLRELSIKCRNNGIVLSVDNYVPAVYNQFYDRKEQGEILDYVVVMGYDEHHGTSEISGSVSSLKFFENGLKETLEVVPKERIIMGVPFFTRVWKESKQKKETVVKSDAHGMQSAWDYMKNLGAEPVWDETLGQYYAEIEKDGTLYKCWFEEDKSMEERMKVIQEASVAGVASWKLGLEKPGTWNIIMKYVN